MGFTLHSENADDGHRSEKKLVEENVIGPGDLWLAVILILLSIGVIFISLRMPRPAGWLSAPGIFPLFSAVLLLFLSVGLFLWTIFKRRPRPTETTPRTFTETFTESKRMLWAIIGTLVYIFLLIPTVHFTIATFIYLLGTLWYFWRGKTYKIILISFLTALLLSEMFKRFFQIMLP